MQFFGRFGGLLFVFFALGFVVLCFEVRDEPAQRPRRRARFGRRRAFGGFEFFAAATPGAGRTRGQQENREVYAPGHTKLFGARPCALEFA